MKNTNPDTEKKMVLDMTLGSMYKRRISRNKKIHKAKDKNPQGKGLVRAANRVYELKMKSGSKFSKKYEVNPFEAGAKMDMTFQATPRPSLNQGMLQDPLATPRPSLNQGMLRDPLATPRPTDVVSSVLSNGLFGMTSLDAQAALETPRPHVVCPMESTRDPLADLQESTQNEDAEGLCDKLEMFSLNRR